MIRASILEALFCYTIIMTSGIYFIKNMDNEKFYIGQSGDMERRLQDHWRALARGKDSCVYLQNAWNKHGADAFMWGFICKCDISDLDDMETFFISQYKSTDPDFGYNISTGGSKGLLGHKKSEETKKRMSIANTKERHPMWGKHQGQESIEKMKEKRSGENNYQFGKKKEGSASKYYGIYKVMRKGHTYWSAYIKRYGSRLYIGASKDEIEAAKMYDKYVIEHNLPNPLNFPD